MESNQASDTINTQNFEQIYLEHYTALHRYAFTILGDEALSEEMVQQVFLKILEKQNAVFLHTSVKAYLYRAVHNECINHIKHEKVKQGYQDYTLHQSDSYTESASRKMQYDELEQQLHRSINALPEQCRTIFQLSRFEELRYAQIAAQLGLSIKTVENQMSKALKRLRADLAAYLPLLLWLLLNIKS